MKEKKKSANWNIAATHWLTSGLAIPFLFALVAVPLLGFIFIFLFGEEKAALPLQASILLLWPLVVWLGVKYSAGYINKKYIIGNSKEIVVLSTVYLVVTRVLYMAYEIFSQGLLKLDHLISVIVIIIFYMASKKYIKQNDSIENLNV